MESNNGENKLEKEEAGLVNTTKGRYPIHCLTVIGQIEGQMSIWPWW